MPSTCRCAPGRATPSSRPGSSATWPTPSEGCASWPGWLARAPGWRCSTRSVAGRWPGGTGVSSMPTTCAASPGSAGCWPTPDGSAPPSTTPRTAGWCSPSGSAARRRDPVGGDRHPQPGLVAAAEPRVRAAEVLLRELLDVLGRALGAHVDDPAADLVVARHVLGVGDVH